MNPARVLATIFGLLVAIAAAGAAGAQTSPPVSPPFVGTLPPNGGVVLLQTTRTVTPSDLSAGLTAAGCTPTVIAITVGGQWVTFVASPAAPTFVNAPFAAAFPTIPGATGFFTRCLPPPLPAGLVLAPIDALEVVRSDSTTPSYWVVVTSGLPSGCAKFERIDTGRSGDVFTLTVLNRVPQTLMPCTAIYGFVTNRVPLTGEIVVGQRYTVVVNDRTTTFVGGSTSIPVGGPPAPSNVRLTGPLADTTMLVPPGEGERGRVSVVWESADASVTGFRIYERDCSGVPTGTPIVVAAAERAYGPLQPCRPGGNFGVAAVSGAGESPTTWAQ